MTTNPEVLRIAREIALQSCGYPPDDATDLETSDDYELNGCYRGAIAAIERTKDLSVQFLRADDGLETITAFERYDHLRQSEKDNSDAD